MEYMEWEAMADIIVDSVNGREVSCYLIFCWNKLWPYFCSRSAFFHEFYPIWSKICKIGISSANSAKALQNWPKLCKIDQTSADLAKLLQIWPKLCKFFPPFVMIETSVIQMIIRRIDVVSKKWWLFQTENLTYQCWYCYYGKVIFVSTCLLQVILEQKVFFIQIHLKTSQNTSEPIS